MDSDRKLETIQFAVSVHIRQTPIITKLVSVKAFEFYKKKISNYCHEKELPIVSSNLTLWFWMVFYILQGAQKLFFTNLHLVRTFFNVYGLARTFFFGTPVSQAEN